VPWSLPFLRPKDSFITCRDRDDGGGAQISARISTMILARLKGMTYAHTPVSDVAHRPEDVPEAEWAQAWEGFFNLGHGEIQAADLKDPLRAIAKPHRFWPRSRFGDFTTPLAPPRPSAPHHPDDLMTWAWAFGVEPRGDEVRVKPARSPRRRTIVGAIAYVLLMATGLGLWYWLRTP